MAVNSVAANDVISRQTRSHPFVREPAYELNVIVRYYTISIERAGIFQKNDS